MAELLKNNDVVRNGKVIGRIECDGAFIAMNFVTRKRITVMTVEEAMQWFNQN